MIRHTNLLFIYHIVIKIPHIENIILFIMLMFKIFFSLIKITLHIYLRTQNQFYILKNW